MRKPAINDTITGRSVSMGHRLSGRIVEQVPTSLMGHDHEPRYRIADVELLDPHESWEAPPSAIVFRI
jgi:hypothetical protein